jgi:hypothetical protein
MLNVMQISTSSVPPSVIFQKDPDYWIDWHLNNWARWMHLGGKPAGFPSKGSGGAQGYTVYSGDMDSSYSHSDGVVACATEAVISDLPPDEKWAIYRQYLDTDYRGDGPFMRSLEQGKRNVERGLKRKGMWMGS